MVNVSMAAGLVMVWMIAITDLMKLTAVLAVQMVNLNVLMVDVFMAAGHVTVWLIVQTALMKLTAVLKAVQMMNLNVLMVDVFMTAGHVTVGVTVQMALMKLIVLLYHVKIKVCGIVAMANVFQQVLFVMDQLIPVMQVGVLIVQMVQMKV